MIVGLSNIKLSNPIFVEVMGLPFRLKSLSLNLP